MSSCFHQVDWGVVNQNSVACAEIYSHNVKLKNITVDTGQPKFERPLIGIRDGGSHVPAQRDVSIFNTCFSCVYPFCFDGFKRFPSHLSIQPRLWSKENSIENVIIFKKAIITSRYDDHNPFFQLSLLLNAWISHGHIGSNSTIMVFGEKIVQNIDILWERVFGGKIMYTSDLPKRFRVNEAWFIRSEYVGPMMQHLNDFQPCRKSKMIVDFFDHCCKAMSVIPVQSVLPIITFIRRKKYAVRKRMRIITRILMNEEYIIDETQRLLSHYEVRGLYMEDLTQQLQIQKMRESRVVIGMHGAGMVNVAFMKPDVSNVIEIFPQNKRRYGYRNLCQYLKINYMEFRKGRDTTDDNKIITLAEWRHYLLQSNANWY
tara:strand:+ start:729 stop:1847 length:1119 start_codon:yes stop_codon:yes gene_type:complete